jgi:hypothetical protein
VGQTEDRSMPTLQVEEFYAPWYPLLVWIRVEWTGGINLF